MDIIFEIAMSIILSAVIVGSFVGMYAGRKVEGSTGGSHGTAHWATNKQLEKVNVFHDKGIIIGKTDKGWMYFDKPGHIFTVAPTGTGKGTSCVIPNLLTYTGSIFINDIKGENFNITAQCRKQMGQDVILLDPFHVTNGLSYSMNWLADITEGNPQAITLASILADMIVIRSTGEENHWNDAAAAFLKGVILHVATWERKEDRHILTVRDKLTQTGKSFEAFLDDMENNNTMHGIVQKAARIFRQKVDKEQSGVLSTIHRHMDFLDSPFIAANLKHEEFAFSKLRDGNTTVYLVIPPDRVKTYSRYIRVTVGLLVNTLTQELKEGNTPHKKVLLLLDEFAQLEYMKPIEDAFSLIRGYGVTLWLLVQDFAQLKATYPKWQSFLSNAAVLQAFGINDFYTAEYLSKLSGVTTVMSRSYGSSSSSEGTHSESSNVSEAARPLIHPDEIRSLDAETLLVFIQGIRPVKAKRVNYLQEKMLQKVIAGEMIEIRQDSHPLPIVQEESMVKLVLSLWIALSLCLAYPSLRKIYKQTYTVLTDNKKYTTSAFSIPKKESRAQKTAEITSKVEKKCQPYTSDIIVDGMKIQKHGIACKQENGVWRIVQ